MRPSPELLAMLMCPAPECRGTLDADREAGVLTCVRCGRRYPVREHWIELIPEEALPPRAATTE